MKRNQKILIIALCVASFTIGHFSNSCSHSRTEVVNTVSHETLTDTSNQSDPMHIIADSLKK